PRALLLAHDRPLEGRREVARLVPPAVGAGPLPGRRPRRPGVGRRRLDVGCRLVGARTRRLRVALATVVPPGEAGEAGIASKRRRKRRLRLARSLFEERLPALEERCEVVARRPVGGDEVDVRPVLCELPLEFRYALFAAGDLALDEFQGRLLL